MAAQSRPRVGGRLRLLVLACVALVVPALAATPASAVQTDMYDPFTKCPTDHPLLQDPDFMWAGGGCVASIAKPGSTFRIGDRTTETTSPSSTQWAFGSFDDELGSLPVVPGSTSITAEREKAEGGLLGIVPPEALAEVVGVLDPVLAVYTQVSEAGDVSEWLLAPPTTRMKIQLINPALGPNCFIGSEENPIVLQNTDWVAEDPGQLQFENDPNGFEVFIIRQVNSVIVNDGFAVPEAEGCGPLGIGVLDPVINGRLGLPSPAGNNEARFLSDAHIVGGPTGTEIQAAFDAAQ